MTIFFSKIDFKNTLRMIPDDCTAVAILEKPQVEEAHETPEQVAEDPRPMEDKVVQKDAKPKPARSASCYGIPGAVCMFVSTFTLAVWFLLVKPEGRATSLHSVLSALVLAIFVAAAPCILTRS